MSLFTLDHIKLLLGEISYNLMVSTVFLGLENSPSISLFVFILISVQGRCGSLWSQWIRGILSAPPLSNELCTGLETLGWKGGIVKLKSRSQSMDSTFTKSQALHNPTHSEDDQRNSPPYLWLEVLLPQHAQDGVTSDFIVVSWNNRN